MENIFIQLAIALTLSCLLGFLVLKNKLPLVIAYLIAGVLLSVVKIFDPTHSTVFEVLPEIGIAFVLFLIGMELDLREIRNLGVPILTSSFGQITISSLAGYSIASTLGFNQTESAYLGIGLAFSSTVVVVKMLLEKRDLASLYGKLSIGITLVEDMVAIGVLMLISLSSTSSNLGQSVVASYTLPLLIAKAAGLFLLTFILSKFVLQRIFDSVAKSIELLFLTAVTWCFLFTSLAILAGFSVVIGAFLAGIALASSPYHLQIQGKVKPLRDFFLTLFFIYLGLQANITDLAYSLPAIIAFTLFAVFFKPFLYLLLLSLFGFRKHTLFQTALNLSQVSEFSLVVLLIGMKAGVSTPKSLSVMAAVAVISIIISSIMIAYSKHLYKFLSPVLSFFEHKSKIHLIESKLEEELEDHVVIIGAHRVGGPVVEYLKKAKIPFIVMDFNPHVVEALRNEGIKVIYGDVSDSEVLDSLHLEKAKLVISTASDVNDNEVLLEECKRRKIPAAVITRATDPLHVEHLKLKGADYVVLPEQVSGDFLVDQLKQHWPNLKFKGLE